MAVPHAAPLPAPHAQVDAPESRRNFSARAFADEYGLGEGPCATAWFLSRPQ